MKKYIILTDSCSDLDKELREEYDIEYIPMSMTFDDKTYIADLDWKEIKAKDYYQIMRDGTRVITSQVMKQDYLAKFEQYIKDDYDILSISCSSALSSSVKASYIARDELLAKYPKSKIICIDSLISCAGLGLLCILASNLRKSGKSIEEVAQFVEENKLKINQVATVNDLKFLKQSGRITASAALFGTLFNVKPIIISDTKGQNVSVEKTKGRKKSLVRLAELTKENYTGEYLPDIFIGQADCEEDAEELKNLIAEKIPNVNIHIGNIGPIVGASVGPEMIGVYFVGKEVTYLAEK